MTNTNPAPAGSGPLGPPAGPDMNAEIYPFEVVVGLLNRCATFHWYARPPGNSGGGAAIRNPDGQIVGWHCQHTMHPLRADLRLRPDRPKPLQAVNAIGPPVARFSHRWMLMPDDFEARPDREPPPTVLDGRRVQRFCMLDAVCHLGDGGSVRDGFEGFGAGCLFPQADGRRWLVGAVGNLSRGIGRFEDLVGTYTLNGEVDPEQGFRGSVLVRIFNAPDDLLTPSGELPYRPLDDDPRGSYFLIHGRKPPSHPPTQLVIGPSGQPSGFKLGQELVQLTPYSTSEGHQTLRSRAEVGRPVGSMRSRVFLNILDPGAPGTADAPIPFSGRNRFELAQEEGSPLAGFGVTGGEGRTFHLTFDRAPAQPALRFGAFRQMVDLSGALAGANGLLSDNSAVGISPHATSTLYMVRLDDPDGRFRASLDG